MSIFQMYPDPESGELRIVLGDRTLGISGVDNQPFSSNNLVERIVSKHGKGDPLGINIRTTYQTEQLLPASSIAHDAHKVARLKEIVSAYRDRLLMMLDCLLHIDREIARCDKAFKYDNGKVQLPQVDQLQEKVESFLLNGKKALRELSKIFSVFLEQHSKEDHKFTEHLKWATRQLGNENAVTKVLEYNMLGDEWPKLLVEMRNRAEHQTKDYWLKVQNFVFDKSSKKMIAPAWATDLQPNLSDIRTDMKVFLNNVLVMSEDLIAACVMETQSNPCLIVGRVHTEKIDPDLPLRWKIFVKGLPPSQ